MTSLDACLAPHECLALVNIGIVVANITETIDREITISSNVNPKPTKDEIKHWLGKIREKLTVSSVPYNVYSLLGLHPWKKIMYNFLLFSAFILIPNGGILKFEVKSNREIIFNDFDISHIPEVLRGSFLVDR